jgi:3-oxoadipate enol-lactonase
MPHTCHLAAAIVLGLAMVPLSAQQSSTVRQVDLTTSGRQVHYEDAGTGPAIVLIHAGWVDSRMWAPQVREFSRDHRVITYDICGFGRSPGGTEPCRDLSDLAAILDHAKIDSAVLVGSSLGSIVALDFAIRYPARVTKLIVAGPAISGGSYSEGSLKAWAAVEALLKAGKNDEALKLRSADRWLTPTLTNTASAPLLRQLLADNLRPSPQRYILTPPAVGRLSEIKAPTLVIQGIDDHPDMNVTVDVLRKGLPSARIETMKAGHFLNLEQTDAFNKLVRQFLSAKP